MWGKYTLGWTWNKETEIGTLYWFIGYLDIGDDINVQCKGP